MTNDEIRFTIAELCGKPFCVHPVSKWQRCGTEGDSELYCSECKRYLHDMRVPNYPEDLNACAEMERALSPGQAVKYRLQLSKLSDGHNAKYISVEAAMCHATARQRCEAFLCVHGKRRKP